MDVDRLILEFERKLVLQRYSANSIANYKSSARSFLDLAKRKFSHPAEIDELAVEKYVLWKIERHRIGSSHQRMIVASIDKFYKSIYGRELKIKHLYPSRRTFALPNCLNIDEVKRIIDGTENIKHRCMIKMLYGSGLRLSELINLEIADIDSARMLIRIVKSKGNKDRVVTLPESILTDLRTCYILHKPDVYLFEGQWGGPYSAKSVQMVVKNAASRAGIRKRVTSGCVLNIFQLPTSTSSGHPSQMS